MPEPHLYEYAVLRVVPLTERGEFINAGVVLFCPKLKFLELRCLLNTARLKALSAAADACEIQEHLNSFGRICCAHPEAGPIGKLDAASRFRWLTATRSTVLQCSKVHPGLCTNPAETLERLFNGLVL